MPSNNTGKIVRDLYKEYPDKIASLISPEGWRKPFGRYAIDNGCYKRFDGKKFIACLNKAKKIHPPLFVVSPDVLGCWERTLILWHFFYPLLKKYSFPIAYVVQNGCTPDKVPSEADWIFVGGTDPWKMESISLFTNLGKPVHVGRVNTLSRLAECERLGVTSCDGTGWMRAREKQFHNFIKYIKGVEDQPCLPLSFS